MSPNADHPPQSSLRTGLLGRCPRCGQGRLFVRFLDLREACEVCAQSFAFADTGDGPSFFVGLIGGFIVLGAALWTELLFGFTSSSSCRSQSSFALVFCAL